VQAEKHDTAKITDTRITFTRFMESLSYSIVFISRKSCINDMVNIEVQKVVRTLILYGK
jgi:hypothetical protein